MQVASPGLLGAAGKAIGRSPSNGRPISRRSQDSHYFEFPLPHPDLGHHMSLKPTLLAFSGSSGFDGDSLMPRKFLSFKQFSILLCLAMSLAILAPVSASASRLIPARGTGNSDGRSLELSIDAQQRNSVVEVFESEWRRKVLWSLLQRDAVGDGLTSERAQEIRQRFQQRWTGIGRRNLGRNPPTSSVPEPSTAVLMMLGFAGLAGSARRLRSSATRQ